MNFAQICVIKRTEVKWCIGRVFYHFTIFGFKNAKKNCEENKGFERSFLGIEVHVISNPSTGLKKHQTSKFLLINIFL